MSTDEISQHAQPSRGTTFWPLLLSAILFVVVVGLYALRFGDEGLASTQDKWGQFGDFVGGVVNPLLGLVTIWLLVATLAQQQRTVVAAHESVRIQKDSLVVQRQELADSRAELAKSAEALDRQAQQFERKNRKDDLISRTNVVFDEIKTLVSKKPQRRFYEGRVESDGYNQSSMLQFQCSMIVDVVDKLSKFASDRALHFVPNAEFDAEETEFELRQLGELFIELSGYIAMIDQLSDGQRANTNYYRRRVYEQVRVIERLGLVDAQLAGSFATGLGDMAAPVAQPEVPR